MAFAICCVTSMVTGGNHCANHWIVYVMQLPVLFIKYKLTYIAFLFSEESFPRDYAMHIIISIIYDSGNNYLFSSLLSRMHSFVCVSCSQFLRCKG